MGTHFFPNRTIAVCFFDSGVCIIATAVRMNGAKNLLTNVNGAKNVLTNVVNELQAAQDMISRAQNATKSMEIATKMVTENVEVEAKQCIVGAQEQMETHKTAVEDATKQCLVSVRDEAEKIIHTVQTESKVLNGMYSLACILCGTEK